MVDTIRSWGRRKKKFRLDLSQISSDEMKTQIAWKYPHNPSESFFTLFYSYRVLRHDSLLCLAFHFLNPLLKPAEVAPISWSTLCRYIGRLSFVPPFPLTLFRGKKAQQKWECLREIIVLLGDSRDSQRWQTDSRKAGEARQESIPGRRDPVLHWQLCQSLNCF